MERIPRDLTLNIFSRLPVYSLLSCKCVCKHWFNLTSDPILSTLRNQLTTTNSITEAIVVTYLPGNQLFFVAEKENTAENHFYSTIIKKKIDISFIHDDSSKIIVSLVGVCNGLLCLVNIRIIGFRSNPFESIHVLNPITGDHLELIPKFENPICRHGLQTYCIILGFGFDEIHRVFKVVAFIFRYDSSIDDNIVDDDDDMTEMLVYTIGGGGGGGATGNNLWRRAFGNVPYILRYHFGPESHKASNVYVNGCLHWVTRTLVQNSLDYKLVILSFHLGYEDFGFIQTPEEIIGELYLLMQSSYYSLAVLDNCLSFVDSKHDEVIDIWLSKNDGGNQSWIKYFSIQKQLVLERGFGHQVMPIKQKMNGEILLLANYHMVVYNPQNKTCRPFAFDDDPEEISGAIAFPFVGSFINAAGS
ncbi:F-box protein [Thalictrum thalictroides]|uniref:F-box protein n=1 Tax=Thalictrum thalictroides TaxID=46969 RepID=A0A7J6W7W7_THATH|nr:F-box protein [Thalictrum thalictroides]